MVHLALCIVSDACLVFSCVPLCLILCCVFPYLSQLPKHEEVYVLSCSSGYVHTSSSSPLPPSYAGFVLSSASSSTSRASPSPLLPADDDNPACPTYYVKQPAMVELGVTTARMLGGCVSGYSLR